MSVPVWIFFIPLSLCLREEPGYTEEWVPQLVLTAHGQTSGIWGLWEVEQKQEPKVTIYTSGGHRGMCSPSAVVIGQRLLLDA